ncbi:hypothetical protein [Micromonospora halophytica]|uniref:Uncharacterized protein n=1 Tax=Micromonospora halophytica TaxID=47864 RepID=A0A1C5IZF3_9ACTN|nr:hypothetical protein [Micromonospora halophytica]SCG63708.1 hypothetical protein GA0070560_11912 [Micromonospora halophytica]
MTSDRSTSRRTLLRRAAVTGGAAVAATAATATPAAASGTPVKLGETNQGGTTTVRSAAPNGGATLVLRNPDGPTLRLGVPGATGGPAAPAGTVAPSPYGLSVSDGSTRHTTLTTANATMLVPIPPTRVLDTRSSAGRARLVQGADRIDAQGRALAETELVVTLAGIGYDIEGLIGNVTVTKTEKGGFATVWGGGVLPSASTINWWTAGQLLSNGVITQVMASGEEPDVVRIRLQKSAAAVILDVTGLLVAHPEYVSINNPKTASTSDLRAAVADDRGVRGGA